MEPAAPTGHPRSRWIAMTCALAALAVAFAGGLHGALGQCAVHGQPAAVGPLPLKLSQTGLFVPGSTTQIDPRNRPFVPQYPLWSDGATKRRWIRLPEGTAIDASDPDAWQLPVGTRFWKEFSFGRRVETRYSERLADGSFRFASYVWSEDGRDAALAPSASGATVATADGRLHEVPRESDCRVCHEGRSSRVLGFNALQLSRDRDPNAPHREAVPRDAIDLDELIASGALQGLPAYALGTPPRIAARSARERAALGYLYGNCSGCHNAEGPIATLGLDLDQHVSTAETPSALRTTLGVASAFAIPNVPTSLRIAPGQVAASALPYRMATRWPASQMPPLGTRAVDDEALELVRNWISKDLAEVGKERERP